MAGCGTRLGARPHPASSSAFSVAPRFDRVTSPHRAVAGPSPVESSMHGRAVDPRTPCLESTTLGGPRDRRPTAPGDERGDRANHSREPRPRASSCRPSAPDDQPPCRDGAGASSNREDQALGRSVPSTLKWPLTRQHGRRPGAGADSDDRPHDDRAKVVEEPQIQGPCSVHPPVAGANGVQHDHRDQQQRQDDHPARHAERHSPPRGAPHHQRQPRAPTHSFRVRRSRWRQPQALTARPRDLGPRASAPRRSGAGRTGPSGRRRQRM
jgi:hypothetical protein